jgi:hypothetical protein
MLAIARSAPIVLAEHVRLQLNHPRSRRRNEFSFFPAST